ncbi:uncharacterized protein SCHCODRAFT_02580133 [Schizophyllum commune H4-8]|nr:uncharacterized protein SCHCODRAFT_02580133 [Schizophyllum commune H4-8]KAI5890988.1 hypothetical protein SCHCODRAFT_02580133 [Schizophyllum commune H4-8]
MASLESLSSSDSYATAMTDSVPFDAKKHERYYFSDGNVEIAVQGFCDTKPTLYNLHRSILESRCPGLAQKHLSHASPLYDLCNYAGLTPWSFDLMLSFVYPERLGVTPSLTAVDWKMVLPLTHEWMMDQLFDEAVRQVKLTPSPTLQIWAARQYNLGDLLLPAFTRICAVPRLSEVKFLSWLKSSDVALISDIRADMKDAEYEGRRFDLEQALVNAKLVSAIEIVPSTQTLHQPVLSGGKGRLFSDVHAPIISGHSQPQSQKDSHESSRVQEVGKTADQATATVDLTKATTVSGITLCLSSSTSSSTAYTDSSVSDECEE